MRPAKPVTRWYLNSLDQKGIWVLRFLNVQILFKAKLVNIDISIATGDANSSFSEKILVRINSSPILTTIPDPPTTPNLKNSYTLARGIFLILDNNFCIIHFEVSSVEQILKISLIAYLYSFGNVFMLFLSSFHNYIRFIKCDCLCFRIKTQD